MLYIKTIRIKRKLCIQFIIIYYNINEITAFITFLASKIKQGIIIEYMNKNP